MKGKKGKSQRWLGIVAILGLLAVFLSGCAAVEPDFRAVEESYEEAPATAPEAVPDEDVDDSAARRRGEVEAAEGRRYIIRNARLTLEIQDIDEAVEQIQAETDRMEGYVSALDIHTISEDRRSGNITLRIPEERFDQAMETIKQLGRILNEQFDTDDVTRQYIDMEARIANLEVQEQRMRELLEQADNVEDVLKVENELSRIRGELESMQGDFKYLQERVRYSTIHVSLRERDPRTQAVADGGGSWEQLGNLLILNTNRLVQGVSGFFIWFVGSLPILIPLGGLAFGGWKLIALRRERKRKKREQQKHEQQAE